MLCEFSSHLYIRLCFIYLQMSWEGDMDDQMTPEAWATMQKLSGSVRISLIFILYPIFKV